MSETQPGSLRLDDAYGARRLSYLIDEPKGDGAALPGLFWMSGFNSVMTSGKATALAAWVAETGRGLTRFDYSGHGQSDGRFEDGTIGQWLADAREAFTRMTAGPQIVVGSSMGGYLALLLARALPEAEAARLAALVLIAPAWNMTERLMWAEMTEDTRRALMAEGVWMRPSDHGNPYPITRRLIEEGRNHLLDIHDLPLPCPLRVLHGARDADVPFDGSVALIRTRSDDATLSAVPDGDHRLAREQDIWLLKRVIGEFDEAS